MHIPQLPGQMSEWPHQARELPGSLTLGQTKNRADFSEEIGRANQEYFLDSIRAGSWVTKPAFFRATRLNRVCHKQFSDQVENMEFFAFR